MYFLDSFIISPSANQLHLSSYIVLLSLLIQLPYFSLLLGFSVFSVVFDLLGKKEQNPSYVRFSELLLNTFPFNKYAVMLFGFAPVLSLYLSLSQFLFKSNVKISYLFAFLLPSLIIGLVLVCGYHYFATASREHPIPPILLGIASIPFLLLSSFLLTSIISSVVNFEKRFFLSSLPQLLLSWNGVARHLLFLSLTLAITGAGALLIFSDWFGGAEDLDDSLGKLTQNFGAVNITAALVAIPLSTVFHFITLPDIALSVPVIFLILLFFAALVSSFLLLQKAKRDYRTFFTPLVFFALITSYSIATVNDVLSIENSTKEHVNHLASRAEAAKPMHADTEKVASVKSAEVEKQGELIFKNRCSACHKFEARLVGPPFLQVLPKYKDNRDRLISFILNPTKVSPDYPPMPKLGLARKDVEAVAKYVLGRLDDEARM